MSKVFRIEKPENFSFRLTVYSHGWSDLSPFEIDKESNSLNYVFAGEKSEEVVSAAISEAGKELEIEISNDKISRKFREKMLHDVRRILRLDDQLGEFYKFTEFEDELAWIGQKKAGRLLRSPTVFEDLVKTICTTNCSWALTKKMVANLVEKLGVKTENGKSTFPTPDKMASVSTEFYKDEIRAGYRAPYFAELAEKVATGKINPENWLDSDLPTNELKREMKQIKGVGDYAAENLLKLVGRYDGLALDSWLRSQFFKKHNNANVCPDSEIEKFYEHFNEWRGLVIWCDLTERWFQMNE